MVVAFIDRIYSYNEMGHSLRWYQVGPKGKHTWFVRACCVPRTRASSARASSARSAALEWLLCTTSSSFRLASYVLRREVCCSCRADSSDARCSDS